MPVPVIISSIYWDEPKKLGCVVVFKNATPEDVDDFMVALKQDVKDNHIFGVAHLMRAVEALAELASANVSVYDQATLFRNEVI